MRYDPNNSIFYSAYASVGSLFGRYTGVENFSYAWNATDPVTGEEYTPGWRAAYTAVGALELVLTATGLEQAGKAGIKALIESCGCFTDGTQIVVGMEQVADESGNLTTVYTTVNIEDVKVGDLVYSYNTLTGEVEQTAVTETFALKSDHVNYLTIVDEDGHEQVIETTDVHPFWVVTNDPDMDRAARDYVFENDLWMYHEDITPTDHGYWVEAKDLKVGDVFLSADGKLSTLTNAVRVEKEGGIAVFNFTVDGNHDYFILAKNYEYGQSCVLVHNAICITGYTKHGLNQAILRDGVGVSSRAILDAVKKPIKTIPQAAGKIKYVGKDAVVVLNNENKVITTWATNSSGFRTPPPTLKIR